MTGELGTTNMWLAIIALVSVAEFLFIAAASVMAWRLYNKVTIAVEQIEQRHIVPLTANVNVLIAEVREVTAKVKHAEESVRGVVTSVEDKARVVAAIAQRGWPVIGAVRAVNAAVRAFAHAGRTEARPVPPRLPSTPHRPWRTV
jgi:uncharacterized protein YoxC